MLHTLRERWRKNITKRLFQRVSFVVKSVRVEKLFDNQHFPCRSEVVRCERIEIQTTCH